MFVCCRCGGRCDGSGRRQQAAGASWGHVLAHGGVVYRTQAVRGGGASMWRALAVLDGRAWRELHSHVCNAAMALPDDALHTLHALLDENTGSQRRRARASRQQPAGGGAAAVRDHMAWRLAHADEPVHAVDLCMAGIVLGRTIHVLLGAPHAHTWRCAYRAPEAAAHKVLLLLHVADTQYQPLLADRMGVHWQHLGQLATGELVPLRQIDAAAPREVRKRVRVEGAPAASKRRARAPSRHSVVEDGLAPGDAMDEVGGAADDAVDALAMLHAAADETARADKCDIRAAAARECSASDSGDSMPPVHRGRAGGRRRRVHRTKRAPPRAGKVAAAASSMCAPVGGCHARACPDKAPRAAVADGCPHVSTPRVAYESLETTPRETPGSGESAAHGASQQTCVQPVPSVRMHTVPSEEHAEPRGAAPPRADNVPAGMLSTHDVEMAARYEHVLQAAKEAFVRERMQEEATEHALVGKVAVLRTPQAAALLGTVQRVTEHDIVEVSNRAFAHWGLRHRSNVYSSFGTHRLRMSCSGRVCAVTAPVAGGALSTRSIRCPLKVWVTVDSGGRVHVDKLALDETLARQMLTACFAAADAAEELRPSFDGLCGMDVQWQQVDGHRLPVACLHDASSPSASQSARHRTIDQVRLLPAATVREDALLRRRLREDERRKRSVAPSDELRQMQVYDAAHVDVCAMSTARMPRLRPSRRRASARPARCCARTASNLSMRAMRTCTWSTRR